MNTKKAVKGIMTKNLILINLNTSFHQVENVFDENKFHHLPVLNEKGTVVGIISRNDFTQLTYQMSKETSGSIYTKKAYENLRAEDFMTPNPVTLHPEDEIGMAADLFLENNYHALPIVADDQLEGIVTTHDLLTYAFYNSPMSDS
jgi:FOG: CBS domain